MSNKLFWPIVIVVSALAAGSFDWANSASPLRPIIIFIFMLIVPGFAFTRLFNFKEFLVEIILAIALSLAISTILGEGMIFLHIWSPASGLGVLIGVSLIGAFLQFMKSRNTLRESEL